MLSKFCRLFLVELILFAAFNCAAQKTLDTLAITRAITGTKGDNQISNTELNNTILAFDRQFDEAIGIYSASRQGKCMILAGRVMKLQRLISKAQAIEYIIKDTTFYYQNIWRDIKADTGVLLSNRIVQSEFNLFYPNGQMPEEYMEIDLDTFRRQISLKRIAFCVDSMNDELIRIRSMHRKNLKELYSFLGKRFLRFDSKQEQFFDEPVMITDVAFSDKYSYVGLDLYGTHYLLEFDKNDNYRLTSKKELWKR